MGPLDISFEAIGTRWNITVKTRLNDAAKQSLEESIKRRINRFDTDYSRFRHDSLVTRMAKNSGTYDLPQDGYELLKFYERLYQATGGLVTPLIGQVMSDAGYDAHYSFRYNDPQSPPDWERVISYSKHKLKMARAAILDFGAAGKGYLVDIICILLDEAGLKSYSVNAGGDIKFKTDKHDTLAVGLENPLDHQQIIGVANIRNQSICASSGSRRKWGAYNHIINPRTLSSPTDIMASWAIAPSAMVADGMATALFFSDPGLLQKRFHFTYAILRSDMSLEYAHDFPAVINKI